MSRIPKPNPGEPLYPDGSSLLRAILEVLGVGAVFILAAHSVVAFATPSLKLSGALSDAEQSVGASFLAGAVTQVALVLALSLLIPDLRRSIRNSLSFGTLPAWGAALIAVSIHSATIAFFFVDDPENIIELSYRNGFLSAIPAIDGWSQEVFFRGYVIYRLARGGAPVALQIIVSAILFAAIHAGYVEDSVFSFLWPMVGTAVLGAFLSWSVLLARGALLPAVFSHGLLVVIVQPWLALS